MTSSAGHCLALVREASRDRFLASLFVPAEKRPALIALYAFDAEIDLVRHKVSEPRIGEIRFQWWRDAIEGLYAGTSSPHPVARELSVAIAAGRLPKQPLIDFIDAHEFDLYDDPMPDLNVLEGYLGETTSAIIHMASLILSGSDGVASADVAGLAGVAQGLTAIVSNLPRASKFLPETLSIGASVAHARKRLAEARALSHQIPRPAFPAFLPVGLADLYLDRIAKLGEMARGGPVELTQLRRQWRLWMAARREKF